MKAKPIPIHNDKNLTIDFLKSLGFKFKEDFFLNSIRDGSGRYDGFIVMRGKNSVLAKTKRDVEKFMKGEQ